MKIVCFVKTIWRTLNNLGGLFAFGAYTSGHDYAEQDDSSLLCEVCGTRFINPTQ